MNVISDTELIGIVRARNGLTDRILFEFALDRANRTMTSAFTGETWPIDTDLCVD